MVSEKFRVRVKLGNEPAYRIAQRAGVNPSVLSKLLCGIEKVKPNDSRIIAVGRALGLAPEECFASAADPVKRETGIAGI